VCPPLYVRRQSSSSLTSKHPVSVGIPKAADHLRILTPCVTIVNPASSRAAQQAVAADSQQRVRIDPWYRSGGGRRAPVLAVSAVGRS
jgi:hypothetical protein